jgi:hypothetical protein
MPAAGVSDMPLLIGCYRFGCEAFRSGVCTPIHRRRDVYYSAYIAFEKRPDEQGSAGPPTGTHRDTITRLLVEIGDGCERLLDERMRGLDCRRVQVDEVWSFVAKKQRQLTTTDDPHRVGDVDPDAAALHTL